MKMFILNDKGTKKFNFSLYLFPERKEIRKKQLSMKIVADSAIPFLQGVLEPWAEVRYLLAAGSPRRTCAMPTPHHPHPHPLRRAPARRFARPSDRLYAANLAGNQQKGSFSAQLKSRSFFYLPDKKTFFGKDARLPRGNSFLLPANGEVRIRDSYPTRSPRLYPLCRKD